MRSSWIMGTAWVLVAGFRAIVKSRDRIGYRLSGEGRRRSAAIPNTRYPIPASRHALDFTTSPLHDLTNHTSNASPRRRPPPMLTSTERILTTHVGSLPRSEALSALLVKRE